MQVTGRDVVMELAARQRERQTKRSRQARPKSKMLKTSTTEQEIMKTTARCVTDFTPLNKSTLARASFLKENTKMSGPFGISAEIIKVKETSCYCDRCLTGEGFKDFKGSSTCGWKTVTVCNEITGPLDSRLGVRVNDWVAADYEGNWYIGQVMQIDEEDGDVKVSFLTEGKGKAAASSFKWPAKKDVLWLERKSILCDIEPPVPVGKTGRVPSN